MLNYKKLGMLGAGVGLFGTVFLSTVSKAVSSLGFINLNLNSMVAHKTADAAGNAVITISTNGLTTAVNTGLGATLSEYASKILAISPIPISTPEWLWTALGGAAFFMLGGYVSEKLGLLKGSKVQQVATIGLTGGALVGTFLTMSLAVPTIGLVISTALTWLILAWIIVKADEKLKLNLVG
jgi:hypothetical protein